MCPTQFDPNRLPFVRCTEQIQEAVRGAGLQSTETGLAHGGKVLTSRDEPVDKVTKALGIDNVPGGFHKWQLPVFFNEPTHLFVTVAEPGSVSPRHSHDEGPGIRFIASGSINHEGRELTAGDWMYVPAGAPYSFTTGRFGATMFYCYSC
jgi:hypothetical protein